MASVTSLDQDMRKLRMSRYTPQSANETKAWIEETLGERLPPGDLLDNLKDGTILCRLVNLVLPPPGVKFKKSAMPFMQMENISHFLRACEQPPLSLPAHDRFLTVDLYESKDPAQVLQCLSAFSRAANAANPSTVQTTIGPRRSGTISPTHSGYANGGGGASAGGFPRHRGISNASQGSHTFNPVRSPPPPAARALSPALTGGSTSSRASKFADGALSPSGPISSWSKKSDEGNTAPAWNIHQYGYMGGANQGSQGIAFGARRQITSAAPLVPSLAERERKRREQEAENERLRIAAEEAEKKRLVEREAEEERARIEEEQRWEEEARRKREEEKARVEQQKREWEAQEKAWKIEEEQRLREEQAAQEAIEKQSRRSRAPSDARLRGQYLSEYQAEQTSTPRSRAASREDPERSAERQRVAELERQLAEAKERERQYEMEREERIRQDRHRHRSRSRARSRSRPAPPPPPPREPSPDQSEASWVAGGEREYLRQQWSDHQRPGEGLSPRPLPEPKPAVAQSTRPLPQPTPTSARPLPDPSSYQQAQNRTSRFLASHPAPLKPSPKTHVAQELTSTSEAAAEDARRAASQAKTKAGGWASKSLLEREMERERERQREWEEAQQVARGTQRDTAQGAGPGESWDVNQYGYMGGDSQNRGGSGIAFGGRRQIIGPRPRP